MSYYLLTNVKLTNIAVYKSTDIRQLRLNGIFCKAGLRNEHFSYTFIISLWINVKFELWSSFLVSPHLISPCSLLPLPQLPGTHVGQWHCPPGPGLPEDAEDQPHALHSCPVSHHHSPAGLILQRIWCIVALLRLFSEVENLTDVILYL